MSDFYQNGIVTTLHNLSSRPLQNMEDELERFALNRPLGLILPCLYSELETEAMPKILEELQRVNYLNQIVIGLDRATESHYRKAIKFFSGLSVAPEIVWNDGPRLRAIDRKLGEVNLSPEEQGKGRNVWFCMGLTLASRKVEAVAMHDCDILTYERGLLARLIYPVANPNFNYQFCKGFYARVANGKMNGRVSRLLVTPLLRSLKKVCGPMEFIEYLDSYRYPLAGEFSFRRDVMNDIRIPSDWGLEIGVLSEMTRNYSTKRLCQVDIADNYDHKHQNLSAEDNKSGLSKMSIDITKAIFRKLATNGMIFNKESFRTIKATYFRVALDFVESYRHDAEINGLTLDIDEEERSVELFAKNIMEAGESFLDNPMETPFIPSWTRVNSALPELQYELMKAVQDDMEEFS